MRRLLKDKWQKENSEYLQQSSSERLLNKYNENGHATTITLQVIRGRFYSTDLSPG